MCNVIFSSQALLVFTRDTAVLDHFQNSSATPPKSYIRGTNTTHNGIIGQPKINADYHTLVLAAPDYVLHMRAKMSKTAALE